MTPSPGPTDSAQVRTQLVTFLELELIGPTQRRCDRCSCRPRPWRTNPLERLNVAPVGALLLEHQEEWQLDRRRVFSELSMTKLDNTGEQVQEQPTAAFAAAA